MERSGRPTDAELEILNVLWATGPATVRAVHQALNEGTAYTTTLKTMQRMADKGLLERDERSRSHVYRVRKTETQTRGAIVADMIDRAFAGSAARLAIQALSTQRATAEELEELRSLLDELEARSAGTA